MQYIVRVGKKHQVRIDRQADYSGEFDVPVGKKNYKVMIRATHPDGGLKTIQVNNRVYPVEVVRRGDGFPTRVVLKGVPYDLQIEKVESTRFRPAAPERDVNGIVNANLPGQILELLVKPGQKIEKRQPLLILEAMKMENEILAPRAGTIERIGVEKGALVMKGDFLLEIA